jgi:precorrin-6y C5,15-methyltransferase (decarboxylating) CbiE subunit
MINIVGVGPGASDYLTEGAKRAIKNSRVVVGGKRVLDELAIPQDARIELPDGMAESAIETLEREGPNGVTLVVSGDPGFYSLARRVVLHFGRELVSITPGISSIQIMAARLCRSWIGMATATLHGRRPDISELASKLDGSAGLVVLLGQPGDVSSDIEWMSSRRELASAWAALGWDLGLRDERIIESGRLEELQACPYIGRLGLLWLERDPQE